MMTKIQRLALAGAAIAALCRLITPVHASTNVNDIFTCHGNVLPRDEESFYIRDEDDPGDYPMVCDFDARLAKRILHTCPPFAYCVVSARGISGNGNYHIIEKIYAIQRKSDRDIHE